MQNPRRSTATKRKAGGKYISNIMLSDYFRCMKPDDQSRWLSYFAQIVPELDHHHIAACVQNLALGVGLLTAINREALVTFIEVLYCNGGRCSTLMPLIIDGLNIVPPYVESNNVGFNNIGFSSTGVTVGRCTSAIYGKNERGSDREIEKSSRDASGDFENKPWRVAGMRNVPICLVLKEPLFHGYQNCDATKDIQNTMREICTQARKYVADFVLPDNHPPRKAVGTYGSASDSASSSAQNSTVLKTVDDSTYRRRAASEFERCEWVAFSTWSASSRDKPHATETAGKLLGLWSGQLASNGNARKSATRCGRVRQLGCGRRLTEVEGKPQPRGKKRMRTHLRNAWKRGESTWMSEQLRQQWNKAANKVIYDSRREVYFYGKSRGSESPA